jgi:hypothetical protein
MKLKLDCPFCEGFAELKNELRTVTYRKEEFNNYSFFYKCSNCGKDFTTTEIDDVNVNQIYNQYREKYSIPFPQQLIAIKENYNLSSAKMSEILGLGANQYRLYEGGEMPSSSTGTLLSLIMNPKDFKDLILRKKETLKIPEKVFSHLNDLILQQKAEAKELKEIIFNSSIIPNRFTGFSIPNFEKFAHIVIYFLKEAFLVTRLNKYLFYADFLNYKRSGFSISGYNYAAIPLGPVPQDYKTVYDLLEEHNYISTVGYETEYDTTEKFVQTKDFDSSLFTPLELESLELVKQKLAPLKTKTIIDMSHEEPGWLANKEKKELISYQKYAFYLKHF